jgi:hypothetical protein
MGHRLSDNSPIFVGLLSDRNRLWGIAYHQCGPIGADFVLGDCYSDSGILNQAFYQNWGKERSDASGRRQTSRGDCGEPGNRLADCPHDNVGNQVIHGRAREYRRRLRLRRYAVTFKRPSQIDGLENYSQGGKFSTFHQALALPCPKVPLSGEIFFPLWALRFHPFEQLVLSAHHQALKHFPFCYAVTLS